MNKIHDYLTSIEEYLRCSLADENLSTTAQIKRQHLLDKFYALDLPPNITRKSGDNNVCNHTFNTSKSAAINSTAGKPLQNGTSNRTADVGAAEVIMVQNELSEGLYEDPDVIDCRHTGTGTASSDVGSDTEYESYSDDDDDPDYVNITKSQQKTEVIEEVRLPRARSKKKKKDACGCPSFINATVSGFLYQKGMLTWTRRFCAIVDHQFACYRSDRESKPLLMLPLAGRDIVYTSRPDIRFSHVLRISQPGSETHWFYTDNKETADIWISHLCAASSAAAASARAKFDAASCESDDPSAACKTDVESSIGDVQTGASSEGGSGDGVVQPKAESANTVDRRLNTGGTIDGRKKSKIGESLTSLIGTLNKKKGDKIKRALTDVSAAECENTVLAGYVNVSREHSGNTPKWIKRFCVVKRGRFDCYKDPLDDTIEFSIMLCDASVDLADKRLKRELAMRLIHDGKETLIEAFNETDYARWLSMLVRETCNSNNAAARGEREPPDGIYDEVFDWSIYQTGDQVTMAAPPPPPLPKHPPPKAPPATNAAFTAPVTQTRDENDYIEPQMVFDNMFDCDKPFADKDDDAFGLEEVVNTAFKHLRDSSLSAIITSAAVHSKVDRTSHVRSSSFSPVSGRRNGGGSTGGGSSIGGGGISSSNGGSQNGKTTRSQPACCSTDPDSPSNDLSSVVKGHSGPTIDEDKELLKSTQNPILIELRREREKKSTAGTQTKESIRCRLDDLRRTQEDIKKKRTSLQSSLADLSDAEKSKVKAELHKLDQEFESINQELTKLSFLAPETSSGFKRNDDYRRSISTSRVTADDGTRIPSFVSVTRNLSLRETSTRSSSAVSVSHTSTGSATSSPSLARYKATSIEKRSSFSDVSDKTAQPLQSARSCTLSSAAGSSSDPNLKSRHASTLPVGLKTYRDFIASDDDGVDFTAGSSKKMVQEKLKLWESMSDNKFQS